MSFTIRFAINRICAMRMPLPVFAAMARRLGVDTIEIRNDLPGVETRDGAHPGTVAAIAADHGLQIRSINALQRFDQFDAGRTADAAAMARYAADCGAQALVLCPTNDPRDERPASRRHDDLVHALSRLRPLLEDHGLTGLVEPLGFAECAVRCKSQAMRAIQDIGSPASLALVHDTFHHHLAGEDAFFAPATGLVHVSGVEDPSIEVDQMRDPHRVLVGPQDRLGNVNQLVRLLAGGYTGLVSFEPFADAIITADDIEQRLAQSMAYLSAAVAASTGADSSSER